MVTAMIALAAFSQGTQDRPKPGALVSKMLAHYHDLSSLTGSIHFTQTAAGKSLSGETQVQFQKPNLLYIKQSMSGADASSARVISNGDRFVYSLPQDTRASVQIMGDSRQAASELVEDVSQWNDEAGAAQVLNLGQIYGVGGGGLPLHPTPPLDIAINRQNDLKSFVGQLATVEDQGDEKINGRNAHLIGGDWRQYDGTPVSGTYQIAITDEGDLLRYIQKETFVDPRVRGMTPTLITSTWMVDLTPNGQVNQKLFSDPILKRRNSK